MLSQYSEPAYALALLDGGSERRAYLLKDRIDDRAQLVAAIRAVAQGGSYVDPKVVERLVAAKSAAEALAARRADPAGARRAAARWRSGANNARSPRRSS